MEINIIEVCLSTILIRIKTKKLLISQKLFSVRIIGLEPTRLAAPDPKSGMSTNFTISAQLWVQR